MKKNIQLFLVCTFFSQFLFSQSNHITYKTWVLQMDNSTKISGFLNEVGDSLLKVSNLTLSNELSIPYRNINELQFRKRGKMTKGVLIGTLSGITVGILAGVILENSSSGFFEGSDFTGNFAFIGGLSGLIAGSLFGSIKVKIPIKGNLKTFKSQREKILKYKLG